MVNVNVAAATRCGVTIAYTPARNAAATAEHTIAMMLSALRGIPAADAAIRRGEWKGDYTWETAGFELETATVGLMRIRRDRQDCGTHSACVWSEGAGLRSVCEARRR